MVKEIMYVAPVVEVIEVEDEKGFAGSNEYTGQGGNSNPF